LSAKVVCQQFFYAHLPVDKLSKVFAQGIFEGSDGHVVQEVASGVQDNCLAF